MITDVNGEGELAQRISADHLRNQLCWENVYARNTETFGQSESLDRASAYDAVVRDLTLMRTSAE